MSIGPAGEIFASSYLCKKGYKIVAKNYRCKLGEIDVIARKGNVLIFCEVKTRQDKKFGEPFEAVAAYKQRRLRRLAEHYLLRHPSNNLIFRFDVISILAGWDGKLKEILHIENAF